MDKDNTTSLFPYSRRLRKTACVTLHESVAMIPEEKFLLIDTDAGTDDAWALFIALAAHKAYDITGIKVVGFTTTCGNARVDDVSVNVTRTLQTVNENSIPIYQGMSEFIASPFKFTDDPPYHGEDGFGDAGLPPISARLENEHAVNAIIRLAEQYKGKLTVVALGPLTNLAMAVKLRPEIKTYIKEIFILGGNMDGQGNTTAAAEFNFYVDPESAAICVDSYLPCKLTILPWEVCLTATSTYKFRSEVLGTMNTPEIQLLNAIEANNLGKNKETWLPPDAVIMACAIDPNIIISTVNKFAKVEVSGTHTRGMLVVDKANTLGQPPNVRLITKLNASTYENYLLWAAGGEPPSHINKNTAKRGRSSGRMKINALKQPYSRY